jgi:DNA mismatch repair protein MutL
MTKIRILDDLTANQIAAGEVVERPSSVVKELVENAIDAGSTRIEVWLEEGGLDRIVVRDNGSGIEPGDLVTAFQRHATSKIHNARDLFQIHTLGFRGEALPSIAAVSKLTCISSNTTSGLGRKLEIEGGKVLSEEDFGCERGTEIQVKSLFYNTPARLKYMKAIQTELGHTSDYIYRMALAYPALSFALYHNGGELLHTTGDGQLLHAFAAVYGTASAKQMVEVKGENSDFQLHGFVSQPSLNRANRNGISLIINGRYIRNFLLNNAILQGYHTLLPINRFPMAVLRIEMDPVLVDVNVHPAKWEVRFSKEQELFSFVQEKISQLFRQQTLIPSGFTPPKLTEAPPKQVQTQINWTVAEPRPKIELPEVRETVRQWIEEEQQVAAKVEVESPRFPALEVIGQAHGTYIVAQNTHGVYLIDQHAAHERIHYEEFYEKFGKPEPVSQELLIPITMEFNPTDAQVVEEKLHLLAEVGVVLEPFGAQSFRVVSHPYWLPKGEERATIEEMIEWLLVEKKTIDVHAIREKSAILCACKASIKANQFQTKADLEKLIDRLAGCKMPFTCPHGRPIVISFSSYELEKMFKRVT